LYARKVEDAQEFAELLRKRWNKMGLKRMTDDQARQLIVDSLSAPSIIEEDLKTTLLESSLTEWLIKSLKAMGESA
jgi:hypothetical protein